MNNKVQHKLYFGVRLNAIGIIILNYLYMERQKLMHLKCFINTFQGRKILIDQYLFCAFLDNILDYSLRIILMIIQSIK